MNETISVSAVGKIVGLSRQDVYNVFKSDNTLATLYYNDKVYPAQVKISAITEVFKKTLPTDMTPYYNKHTPKEAKKKNKQSNTIANSIEEQKGSAEVDIYKKTIEILEAQIKEQQTRLEKQEQSIKDKDSTIEKLTMRVADMSDKMAVLVSQQQQLTANTTEALKTASDTPANITTALVPKEAKFGFLSRLKGVFNI